MQAPSPPEPFFEPPEWAKWVSFVPSEALQHNYDRERTLLSVHQILFPLPLGCTAKLHFPASLAVRSCDHIWAIGKWEEVMHSPCWKMMAHEKLPFFQVLFLCLLDRYRESSREHQGPEDDVGTEQKKPGSLKDYMESHSTNIHHELSCGQQTSTVKFIEILESSL